MNREQFMAELKERLKRLPFDELKNAIDYYEEYFDEAGEEAALRQLGTPAEVASQIISEFAEKSLSTRVKKPKTSIGWSVLLGIFAAPIALPLTFAFIMVIFALIIVIFAFVFSIGVSGLTFLVAGIVSLVSSIVVLATDFATGIVLMGVSFTLIGLGYLLGHATMVLSKASVRGITKLMTKFLQRRGGRNNAKQQ